MKIMYCITSSSWGGAQLHVLELCQHEISIGNSVTFIVGNEGELVDRVRKIPGVKVIVLKTLHREISLFNDIKAVFDLRSIIKQIKPDILHLHSSKAGIIGRLAGRGKLVKTVFTVHGWAFTDGIASSLKKVLFRNIEKIVSPLTDLFICVSEYDYKIGVRDKVIRKASRAIVVHNGVPKPPKRVRRGVISEGATIHAVMTARFSDQKDQKTLIQELGKISKNLLQVTFVGDGPTLEACKALVDELGLEKSVHFTGFAHDVSPFLMNSDLYILSTHYEGLPISIIEALSYSLPVITNDVGGNSELINKNGYLVKQSSDWNRYLNMLITNPGLLASMGEKSFELFENEFEISKMFKKIDIAYSQLLN